MNLHIFLHFPCVFFWPKRLLIINCASSLLPCLECSTGVKTTQKCWPRPVPGGTSCHHCTELSLCALCGNQGVVGCTEEQRAASMRRSEERDKVEAIAMPVSGDAENTWSNRTARWPQRVAAHAGSCADMYDQTKSGATAANSRMMSLRLKTKLISCLREACFFYMIRTERNFS